MFGAWHEWLVWLAALVCTGAAVKLMDDFLDADYDLCRGERTLAVQFGRATLPYALVLALVGAAIDAKIAVAVFFGSYVVGMFSTWRETLPTRVPAYIEIVIACLISAAFSGWRLALWGVAMMAVIDWLDDVVDVTSDRQAGQANVAGHIGLAETLLLILAALCTAVLSNAQLTGIGFIALAILSVAAEMTTTQIWQTYDRGDGGIDA